MIVVTISAHRQVDPIDGRTFKRSTVCRSTWEEPRAFPNRRWCSRSTMSSRIARLYRGVGGRTAAPAPCCCWSAPRGFIQCGGRTLFFAARSCTSLKTVSWIYSTIIITTTIIIITILIIIYHHHSHHHYYHYHYHHHRYSHHGDQSHSDFATLQLKRSRQHQDGLATVSFESCERHAIEPLARGATAFVSQPLAKSCEVQLPLVEVAVVEDVPAVEAIPGMLYRKQHVR